MKPKKNDSDLQSQGFSIYYINTAFGALWNETISFWVAIESWVYVNFIENGPILIHHQIIHK